MVFALIQNLLKYTGLFVKVSYVPAVPTVPATDCVHTMLYKKLYNANASASASVIKYFRKWIYMQEKRQVDQNMPQRAYD